jgi:hypothetical protein
MKSKGPRILPYGTPMSIFLNSESLKPIDTA